MFTQKGISLIETLATLSIILIMLSLFARTEQNLKSLKAHKLCSKIESYLYALRFIAEQSGTETLFSTNNTGVILGTSSEKIIFRDTTGPNQVNISSGATGLKSIHFYPQNASSPGLIEVSSDGNPYCWLSISLRGRIRKKRYE